MKFDIGEIEFNTGEMEFDTGDARDYRLAREDRSGYVTCCFTTS
jgi:hypothetical protein